jgi:cation:H+ antiporter
MSELLSLAAGVLILLLGGFLVVEGASSLAHRLGVSDLVVGLTVVAFGTSAPELAVNVSALASGQAGVAWGNVVGSNIANIGLILGLAALIRPLDIQSELLTRELPMMLLATAAVVVLALEPTLTGRTGRLDRGDGLILLLLFTVFLYGAVRAVYRKRDADALLSSSAAAAPAVTRVAPLRSIAMLLGGLAALAGGGFLAVEGATLLAARAGVPPAVMGATVVAVGTSLPELVTSLVAAVRGAADLAVGNVVGSNIFNLLFILGFTATASPIEVPATGYRDLAALAVLSLLVLPFALTNDRTVVRREGFILLAMWLGYVGWSFGS